MGARRYAGLAFNFAVGFFAVIGIHAATRLRTINYEVEPAPGAGSAQGKGG